ncbi:Outer membrane protein assembly factor BamD [Andreprevotia sp. IGB-42]|uniref:outer membrane protein assembly factor BamD n=1 Tax=Andreprevotia sp. IGB-42 TaxID=2497473 RepID=UPI00135A3EE7|nr:outer membrane protein assembly factor BamD [Andreprevotia sp. IGB-42]KAF0813065.1 Outer membrane protein assembly factor BamD [Andreprevotia sp. IGB-42]
MKQILPRFFLASVAAVLVAGCASEPKDKDETKGWPAEKLFSEAKAEQAAKSYTKSIELFEKLEARFPYGKYAQQAQLEIAYDQYKDQEPLLAQAAIDRFIKTNPAHPSMDYALYLKGLVSFNEVQGFGSAMFKQDMSERDPKAARESFEAFRQLVNRYPDSKYTGDATARMDYLIGALASYELHVSKYYYKRGAYLAAANRGKLLIETYPKTRQVEGGLGMMVISYDKLGLNDLRDDAKRVLLQNYPKTVVLDPAFLDGDPWWRPW